MIVIAYSYPNAGAGSHHKILISLFLTLCWGRLTSYGAFLVAAVSGVTAGSLTNINCVGIIYSAAILSVLVSKSSITKA